MAQDLCTMKRQLGSAEETWTRCTASGTGIGVFGIALNQSVELQDLTRAAVTLGENHALFRSQIVSESSKSKKLFFEVKKDNIPVVKSLPWPADCNSVTGILLLPGDDSHEHSLSKALHAIVTNELNTPIHATGDYPVEIFEVRLYSNPAHPQAVVVLRFHSGAFDRHSTAFAANEFVRILDNQVLRDSELGKDQDGILPCMEDLVPKSKSSKGFFKKGLDAVGYAYNSSKTSLLPFAPGAPKAFSGPFASRIITHSLKNPAEIFAACKKENTTFAGAISAAFLKTAADLKELKEKKQDTFAFTKVLSCRPHFDPPMDDSVMGNYSAGLPADEHIKDGVSFWELARSISAATEKSIAKSHHFSELSVLNMLLAQVVKHPSLTPASSMRTAVFTVFVDEPVKFSWSNVEKLKVAGTIGPVASMHYVGPCLSVAEALVDDKLSLTFVYTEPVHSREQIQSFVTTALELLVASK